MLTKSADNREEYIDENPETLKPDSTLKVARAIGELALSHPIDLFLTYPQALARQDLARTIKENISKENTQLRIFCGSHDAVSPLEGNLALNQALTEAEYETALVIGKGDTHAMSESANRLAGTFA